jgi:hypothetical protein
MVPQSYQFFMGASMQASAALMGLLFVAVSLAPHAVFGPKSEPLRRAKALGSFAALAAIFFISVAALIPGVNIGPVGIAMAVLALSQSLGLALTRETWSHKESRPASVMLLIVTAVVYGYTLWASVRLVGSPHDVGALRSLLVAMLGMFALGLGRAWQLMGGQVGGLREHLRRVVHLADAHPLRQDKDNDEETKNQKQETPSGSV